MRNRLSREQFAGYVWNQCVRLGLFEEKTISVLKHGKTTNPQSLPFKLIILINQNFNNLYEVSHFFAPMYKNKNFPKFKEMLNDISPFSESEILVTSPIFSVEWEAPKPVYTQIYQD